MFSGVCMRKIIIVGVASCGLALERIMQAAADKEREAVAAEIRKLDQMQERAVQLKPEPGAWWGLSERKGKGQKARERSQRRAKGW